MDIQVASNFERFLYYSLGRDGARVRAVMRQIASKGGYRFPDFDRDTFIVVAVHGRRDPRDHPPGAPRATATSSTRTRPAPSRASTQSRPSVVLATAHPAKFPDTIRAAIGIEPTHPSLEALKGLPLVRHKIVADAAAIRAFIESRAI